MAWLLERQVSSTNREWVRFHVGGGHICKTLQIYPGIAMPVSCSVNVHLSVCFRVSLLQYSLKPIKLIGFTPSRIYASHPA